MDSHRKELSLAMGKDKEARPETPGGDGLLQRLLTTRTLIISGAVDSELAQKVLQQLILLDSDDNKDPITVLINSPGGEVFSGFAIYDTLRYIAAPIITVVSGLAASMGSIISLAGDKGSRYALPNSKILIHQPLMTGYQGRATDLEIQAKEILKDRERIIELYARHTGHKAEQVARDIERDNWMSPEQAKEYGLIDHIIERRDQIQKISGGKK
ncbi:MAG: ATP-dependent Clp protease proteolytic subunit [Deltaproteobacteria bacterium]|nr:ATP-dependent Clp protease proteolytic subunit [Deltaproteobacteria bacterium]